MSKSLGNFMLLKDVLGALRRAGHPPAHAADALPQPARLLDRPSRRDDARLRAPREPRAQPALGARCPVLPASAHHLQPATRSPLPAMRHAEKFDAEMDDDFNTAGALACGLRTRTRGEHIPRREPDAARRGRPRAPRCDAEDRIVELLGVLGIEVTDRGRGGSSARRCRTRKPTRRLRRHRTPRRRSTCAARSTRGRSHRAELDGRRRGSRRAGHARLHIEDTAQGRACPTGR